MTASWSLRAARRSVSEYGVPALWTLTVGGKVEVDVGRVRTETVKALLEVRAETIEGPRLPPAYSDVRWK